VVTTPGGDFADGAAAEIGDIDIVCAVGGERRIGWLKLAAAPVASALP